MVECLNNLVICAKCHQAKPRTDFYACRRKANGCESWCKACVLGFKSTKRKLLKQKTKRRSNNCGTLTISSVFENAVENAPCSFEELAAGFIQQVLGE